MTAWTEHVKSYASSKGISYREALKDPNCKATYTKSSSGVSRKPKGKSVSSIMGKHHEKTIYQPKGYERVYKGDSMLKDVLAKFRGGPKLSKEKKKLYPAGFSRVSSEEKTSDSKDDLVGESKSSSSSSSVGGGGPLKKRGMSYQ